ncbi:LLM class flavin-dependent oxidoreductase [Hymenobacter lutimineralis]|uniref:Luciferase-like monooxygenase n=1 Tax=Hymenobacter lutimineralis TaxID=2606448 RepID=A0A5D6VGF6_9BACT|nr:MULTISPECIES: LLM class flavin-dependent oxidoreductase [Hymenobacter]QIX60106.1 LLM class flavin-dependent oxidoreductase [Hymenobacter sp. BT18]TYZ14460.1 LLM class flavin-dependent oxidoreductase [Hymenobacter lutimineralis]
MNPDFSTSPAPLRLSVLDQSPVPLGRTPREALLHTIELARLADNLGYTRFWVSEHHNTNTLAGSAPEVLLARLGAETRRIRLGSGGVMLPHYAALKVAENFRLLETLYPGRIDLGIGRAPGTDRITAHALNPHNQFRDEDFAEQLMDLRAFLRDDVVADTIHAKVKAAPFADTVPEMWLLSSSGQSGLFAAHVGAAFSFAHFINPNGGPKMVQLYKERFRPSPELAAPQANVAIFVACADTESHARALADNLALQMLKLETGQFTPMEPLSQVNVGALSPDLQTRLAYHHTRIVSGTPDKVKAELIALADSYGVDEVVAVSIMHDYDDRLRSYQLLAEAFALNPVQQMLA